jgi:hypothetical protein
VLLVIGIATWLCAVFVVLRMFAVVARADALTLRLHTDGR